MENVVQKNNRYGDISVLISVYKNDDCFMFSQAMNSIINQTLKPKDIVLVRDGQVGASLQLEIDKYINMECVNYYPLDTNVGLGKALDFALHQAKYEIIARMDSDDISRLDRFEIQYKFLEKNNVDVVGSNILEFNDSIDKPVGIRYVPSNNKDIVNELKRRNPMNHVTVMMKKSVVIDCGGYIDFLYHEDYYLWIRIIEKGYILANINENLVYVRVGKEMYKRRGGANYFKASKKLQKTLLEKKLINKTEYFKNVMIRWLVQVILPSSIRGFVFKKLTRRKVND